MHPVSALSWRTRLAAWIERPPIQRALVVLILINALVLGLETVPAATAWRPWLVILDHAILVVFVFEIALRIVAHGLRFFRDPWSVFDFVVVGVALLPATGAFSVLRALRVLRVLRLLSMVPSMRRVVSGLLGALPGLGSVFAILALIFYVASVMAAKLFGESFPEMFGSLGASAFTLFQVMTLEGWSGDVTRPVMARYPYAWIFFIGFILVATFTMLNLFIAVIVNAIQAEHASEANGTGVDGGALSDRGADLAGEIRALRGEVAELRRALAHVHAGNR
jgi:voltage-gated sodium channel